MKIIILISIFYINIFAIQLGKIPKQIILNNNKGGVISDSSVWDSKSIKDKVYVLFYVDPDKKDLNKKFTDMLKAEEFDENKFSTIVVINYAATWKPNFILENILKAKQKEFPTTLYVRDNKKVLMNQWGLKDDSYDILIFSKDGKVVFYNSGQMSYNNILKAIYIIKEEI